MLDLKLNFLAVTQFIPHGHCYLWQSNLVWLHVLSDSLIAIAYYAIPLALVYFVRKRKDLPYPWIFLLFGAFIISCGTTHIMEIWTLWHPDYWASGFIKALTALISVITTLALIPVIPKLLDLPSPTLLERVNQSLKNEINDHKRREKLLAIESAIAFILAESNTISEANPKILQVICDNLAWDWGELWTIEGENLEKPISQVSSLASLTCLEIWHKPSLELPEFEAKTRQLSFFPNIGLPGRVWVSEKPTWIENIAEDNNFLRHSEIRGANFQSCFAFPILIKNTVVGVYTFFGKNQRPPESDLLNLFNILGNQIGQFVQRQQAELSLRESQGLLQAIMDSSPDGIMAFESIRDKDDQIVDFRWILVNQAGAKVVNRTPAELIGKLMLTELPENKISRLFDDYVHVVETGEVLEQEIYYNDACFTHTSVKIEDGFTATFRDITANKQAEVYLRESDQNFHLSFNNAPSGMGLLAPDGRWLKVNLYLCEMLGYKESELLKKTSQDITHIDDLQQDLHYLRQILNQEIPDFHIEKRYLHKLGHIIWVLLSLSLICDEDNQPLYLIFQIQDITARKKSEAAMANSLKEKEVMIQEIHHRVKNNLQVICSLLNLQSRCLQDKEALSQFKEIQNRVKSMALIHEQLYHSKDLYSISLSKYIKELTNNLFRSYAINKIKIKTEIEDVFQLDIDAAVPCGLIINELISNALKYAFKPQQQGEILIQALPNAEGHLVLTIADNGKGLPPDFQLENTRTMGLNLVKNLTNQLRGKISFNIESGTKFILTLTTIKSN